MKEIDEHIQGYLSALLDQGATALEVKLIASVIEVFIKERSREEITAENAAAFCDKHFTDTSQYYMHEHLFFFAEEIEGENNAIQ